MTQNTLPSPPARQRISWLLALPKFGIVLLMLALMALLWLLQHSEKEEQRNLLIKDVLWLEQTFASTWRATGIYCSKLQST